MPGRRVPRQSAERAVSQHAYRAFSGALDGASALPAPAIDWSLSNSNNNQSPALYFYQDEFILTSATQQVTLTYLPVPYSEHAYLCLGGGVSGSYQREKITWTRDSGKRDLQILTGMNARPGDVLVVEYAYYEQEAKPREKDPCVNPAVYPLIHLSDPTSVYADAYNNVMPPALGMPAVSAPYNNPDLSGGFFWWGEEIIEAGDPIAPGSVSSYKTVRLDPPPHPGYSEAAGHEINVYGGHIAPKWNSATYIGASTWLKCIGIAGNTGGASDQFNATLELYWGPFNRLVHNFTCQRNTNEWSAKLYNGSVGAATSTHIMTDFAAYPQEGTTSFCRMNIEVLTQTITFQFDDHTWAYSGDDVIPINDPAWNVQPPMFLDSTGSNISFRWNLGGSTRVPEITLLSDKLSIATDAPWCVW